MKKTLSFYYDVSGQGEYDNWSYCADNDMWYEDKKEVLPIPKAQTEFIKDLTCEIKVDYTLYIDQDWSKIEHSNCLEQYAEFISRKNNGTNAVDSAILLKTPKQECPICISQEGLWYLNCFLKQLKEKSFCAEYIEQWYCFKFIAWTDKSNQTRLVIHAYMDEYDKFSQTVFDITINKNILISKLENIINIWKQTVYNAVKKQEEITGRKTNTFRYDYALANFFPQLGLKL